MAVINTGDLAYVPSKATLVHYDRTGCVNRATITTQPSLVLVTNVDEQKGYEIIYEGGCWFINKKSIYPVDADEYKEYKNASNID